MINELEGKRQDRVRLYRAQFEVISVQLSFLLVDNSPPLYKIYEHTDENDYYMYSHVQ